MTAPTVRFAPTLADLARRLKRPSAAEGLPRLVLMSDPVRLPDPTRALAGLPRGSAVILRDYGAPDREDRGRVLVRTCRSRGVRLLVAGDPGLALLIGADGVHLPERLARRMAACGRWRRPRPGLMLTVAAHGPVALWAARRLGADAAVLSPVFPTASHPGARCLGPSRFALLARRAGVPVYALGGVTAATARRLVRLPVAGFAGIGGFAG